MSYDFRLTSNFIDLLLRGSNFIDIIYVIIDFNPMVEFIIQICGKKFTMS